MKHTPHTRPSRPLHVRPSQRLAATAILLAACAGCVAPDIDPSEDFKHASDLVAARSDWTPSWCDPSQDGADAWDGASPLTVQQAVTIALSNNRGLRAELEGIAGAKADLAQSGLLPNPVLSFGLGTNSDGNPIAYGLVQELTQLWLRPSQQDAAAVALRQAVESVSDHALRLVADVRNAHAKVDYGQRGMALTDARIALVQRALTAAQSRLEVGDGTQLDLNRLREEFLSAQADLEAQRLELQTTKRDLLAMLSRAADGADWDAVADERLRDAGLATLTETDAVTRASLLRLDVAAARSIYEQREHELGTAKLGDIPGVSVGATYDRDETGLRTRSGELDVDVPIFDTNKVAVAKARSDLRRARAEADEVLQSAIRQTRSAFLALQSSRQLVDFYREQVVALARDNLDLAQQSFDAGESDLTVLLDTQREVSDAEIKLNDLELGAATSVTELEYVVGGKL